MRLPENGRYGSQNIVKSAREYQERKQSQVVLSNLCLPDYFMQQNGTLVNHIGGK
jgi:hypothetical protein